ncbi:GTPase [Acetobacter orientalis]|uniref:GTPase n=1 Tax=Acetobacter orientalis TaxID=146474 RepID=A0A2Z5ZFK1_9PROT|nr:GTPase [Acetobacter orientalis]
MCQTYAAVSLLPLARKRPLTCSPCLCRAIGVLYSTLRVLCVQGRHAPSVLITLF